MEEAQISKLLASVEPEERTRGLELVCDYYPSYVAWEVRAYLNAMAQPLSSQELGDVVQEVFMNLVEIVDDGRYVDSHSLKALLKTLAHRRVIDLFRKEWRRPIEHQMDFHAEDESGTGVGGKWLESPDRTSAKLRHSELLIHLLSFAERLGRTRRIVIRTAIDLAVTLGRWPTVAELTEEVKRRGFELCAKTVSSAYYRARDELREYLTRRGYE